MYILVHGDESYKETCFSDEHWCITRFWALSWFPSVSPTNPPHSCFIQISRILYDLSNWQLLSIIFISHTRNGYKMHLLSTTFYHFVVNRLPGNYAILILRFISFCRTPSWCKLEPTEISISNELRGSDNHCSECAIWYSHSSDYKQPWYSLPGCDVM